MSLSSIPLRAHTMRIFVSIVLLSVALLQMFLLISCFHPACLFNYPVIPDPLIPFTWSSRPSYLPPIPSLVPHYLGPLTCFLLDCPVSYYQARQRIVYCS